eukprot:2494332-Prymnesium_polylepis.1
MEVVLLCGNEHARELETALPDEFKLTHIEVSEPRLLSLLKLLADRAKKATELLTYENFYESLSLETLPQQVEMRCQEYEARQVQENERLKVQQLEQLGYMYEEIVKVAKEKVQQTLQTEFPALSRQFESLNDILPQMHTDDVSFAEGTTIQLQPQLSLVRVRSIASDGGEPETIGLALVCQTETDEPEYPLPVLIEASWLIEGQRYVVSLHSFGLPQLKQNEERLNLTIETLMSKLTKSFQDIDSGVEPGVLEPLHGESVRIDSCLLTEIVTEENTEALPPACQPQLCRTSSIEMADVSKQLHELFPEGKFKSAVVKSLKVKLKGLAKPANLPKDLINSENETNLSSKIYEKQKEVGNRLFERARKALAERWDDFESVEFLVLTANFTTLRDQNSNRLADEGLLAPSGEDGIEDNRKEVCFAYTATAENLKSYKNFRDRA